MTYQPLWTPEVEARIRAEARSLDEQTIPDHVQMCVRCVQTNQRPRIVFNEAGICSACRYADRKKNEIDWDARQAELVELLWDHCRAGGARGYDVVVPCSGGKDSSFVASTMKSYGMHPLCATWAPFEWTDIGWRNLMAFGEHFDLVIARPKAFLHRKLARLAVEFYGDNFLPFIYGQLCWPMHVAYQNGVGLVFFGENGEAEYGGDPGANDKPCWDEADWERVYMKGGSVDKLCRLGRNLGALSLEEIQSLSSFYQLPHIFNSESSAVRPEFHWLGYYLPWKAQSNYYHAVEHTGFECNPERSPATYSKYASIDDKLDSLHYRLGFCKFGIGRTTSDAAHEIRDGELTREEGLALVAKYDDEHPSEGPYWQETLDYLMIDPDWYEEIEARFRPGQ